ncbi:mitogen-activated protein kinase kinase 3 isoform X4 [Iris pallida]|uniref:mitogen-activated protein kinase kinase n=1 Tax=Iris pallida TaxID=29817 RepID=A0AAX6E7Q6_IRIPA|nr:mitogen-activated protein kinase kinase 3 isoform X4 [Iris pallida]
MAALEELKMKLKQFSDAAEGNGNSVGLCMEPCDSDMVCDGGTVDLVSRSCGVFNINELGLQKHTDTGGLVDEVTGETMYRCASHEMHTFGAISHGGSSVVHRAIHVPIHRILALKKINIFEKEKRQQLLNEIRTLCEACCFQGLVEFQGAFYAPGSGQISIALEYMDGGSLADVIRLQKSIPETVLSHIFQKLLIALNYLHSERHLVHRDIKPANLLMNLKGEAKITDFGISAYLDNAVSMCGGFVGTVTYMSPERLRNEKYSYSADIWSIGLAIFECGSGKYPYTANDGPADVMLQILYDPLPTPGDSFSPEFCSFVDDCLQKDPDARPTVEELLSHPFIKKYEKETVDLAKYIRGVFDPTQRLKEIAQMLTVHYYLLFDGADGLWTYTKSFYMDDSTFSFSGKTYVGTRDIFATLSDIRRKLIGERPREKLVHVVEKFHCRPHGEDNIAIHVSGSFIAGTHFLICGSCVQVDGMPDFRELSPDIDTKRVGTFHEQFHVVPGSIIGTFEIARQELHILQK